MVLSQDSLLKAFDEALANLEEGSLENAIRKKLKKEHGKCRGKLYSMGLIAYRNPLTLYCHSHQEIRPIKGNVKITDLMKHNIDTLEFVWKQSYDFIRR